MIIRGQCTHFVRIPVCVYIVYVCVDMVRVVTLVYTTHMYVYR